MFNNVETMSRVMTNVNALDDPCLGRENNSALVFSGSVSSGKHASLWSFMARLCTRVWGREGVEE